MTARCALAIALLKGEIINVKNSLDICALSNPAREIPRLIEKPFELIVSRQKMEGKSRYGQPVAWTNYRLNKHAAYNQEGIKKMREYIKENLPSGNEIKTDAQAKLNKQLNLL
jgi:hypothetical protein